MLIESSRGTQTGPLFFLPAHGQRAALSGRTGLCTVHWSHTPAVSSCPRSLAGQLRCRVRPLKGLWLTFALLCGSQQISPPWGCCPPASVWGCFQPDIWQHRHQELRPALQMPPPSAWGHKGTGERGLTQSLRGPCRTLLTAQGEQRLCRSEVIIVVRAGG